MSSRDSIGGLLLEIERLIADPAKLVYWRDLPEICRRVRRRCEPVGECRIFRGALNKGYGRIKVYGRCYVAHRAIYDQAHGITAPWRCISHLCSERACCALPHLVERSTSECMRAVFGAPKSLLSEPQLRMLRAMRDSRTVRPYRQEWSTLWSLRKLKLVHRGPDCAYRLSETGEDVLSRLES